MLHAYSVRIVFCFLSRPRFCNTRLHSCHFVDCVAAPVLPPRVPRGYVAEDRSARRRVQESVAVRLVGIGDLCQLKLCIAIRNCEIVRHIQL